MPESSNSANLPEAVSQTIGRLGEAVSSMLGGDVGAANSLVGKRMEHTAIALLIIIVTYFAAKLVARWVSAGICHRVDETLGKFLGRLTFYTIMICVGMSILSFVGIGVAGPAAVFTAAGFAVGLAFQGTLSNFAAGILLMVFRPFKVGDMVIAAGVTGRVNEIDLFTTTLDTPDNRRLIVPNSSISGSTIENVTFHAHRRVDVPVGVAYHCGLDETRQALTNAADSLSEFLIPGENRGYEILLTNLGASSVDWTIRFWAATKDYVDVKEKLTAQIKRQLEIAGLEIPFPQMQLHLAPETATADGQPIEQPEILKMRPRLRTTLRQAG